MSKRFLLALFIFTISTAWVISMPDFSYIKRITEEMIPMPEVQFELPEVLIGEFVMISSDDDHYITIFPNNKYILHYYIPDGTAEIEINSNGSITITMLYSPYPEYINEYMVEIPELQFPARLVLEF